MTIHQPAPLTAFTGLMTLVAVGAGVFLATGKYARTEQVAGWISPDAGLSQIYSPRAGVATSVAVSVGSVVHADQPLATLSSDVFGDQGALSVQERERALDRVNETALQLKENVQKQNLDKSNIHNNIDTIRADISFLVKQEGLASEQFKLAKHELDVIQPLVSKGFIAQVDVDSRQAAVAARESALIDIQRQLAAKRAEAEDQASQLRNVDISTSVAASTLRASRSALLQSVSEYDLQGKAVLKSPIDGTVLASNVHVGDALTPAMPLFAIAAKGARPAAELLIPTRSAGFIRPGQSVRLMVDAFPSQRFGPLKGAVLTVSHSTIEPGQMVSPVPFTEPMYRVTVRLASDSIRAYGKAQPLQPGMTLKAFVSTAKRSFLEWMMDPLLAASRRT